MPTHEDVVPQVLGAFASALPLLVNAWGLPVKSSRTNLTKGLVFIHLSECDRKLSPDSLHLRNEILNYLEKRRLLLKDDSVPLRYFRIVQNAHETIATLIPQWRYHPIF